MPPLNSSCDAWTHVLVIPADGHWAISSAVRVLRRVPNRTERLCVLLPAPIMPFLFSYYYGQRLSGLAVLPACTLFGCCWYLPASRWNKRCPQIVVTASNQRNTVHTTTFSIMITALGHSLMQLILLDVAKGVGNIPKFHLCNIQQKEIKNDEANTKKKKKKKACKIF